MSEQIESTIHFMADVGGRIECAVSEERNPKPEIKEEDELKRAIKEMLVENTGCSILDSGGAYGRGWEKNRHRNFDKEEAVILNVWKDEVNVGYNIYHYLVNFLDISEESKRLNTELQKFISESEESYLQDIDNFIGQCKAKEYSSHGITNTYSYDNILSEILQYAIIINDETDEHFIILQIHNGCDARGGYTKPRIFSLDSDDNYSYFLIAQHDVSAFCEKCKMSWYSNNSGYSWYNDGNYSTQEELPIDTEPEEDLKIACDQKNNRVYHKNCGGKITYSVTESW